MQASLYGFPYGSRAHCTTGHLSGFGFECLTSNICTVSPNMSLNRKLVVIKFIFEVEAVFSWQKDCSGQEYGVTSFTLSGCCRHEEKVQH